MTEPGSARHYYDKMGCEVSFDERRKWDDEQAAEEAKRKAEPAPKPAPCTASKSIAARHHDDDIILEAVGTVMGEVEAGLIKRIDQINATLDARLVQMRRDFIQSVKSKAVEMARYEVDSRIQMSIEAALNDHREERVALVRRVEQLADQIERMKQEAGR